MNKENRDKKKATSSRNRHNGRINSMKQSVLDRGTRVVSPDGTVYSRVFTGWVTPDSMLNGVKVPKYTFVRVPAEGGRDE